MSSTQEAGLTDHAVPAGATGGPVGPPAPAGRPASPAVAPAAAPLARPLPEQVGVRTRCLAYRARRFAYEVQGRFAGHA